MPLAAISGDVAWVFLNKLLICSINPGLESQQLLGGSTCWPHVTPKHTRWSFTSVCGQVDLRLAIGWQVLAFNGLYNLEIIIYYSIKCYQIHLIAQVLTCRTTKSELTSSIFDTFINVQMNLSGTRYTQIREGSYLIEKMWIWLTKLILNRLDGAYC